MENASQALLMAAGILIGLIIISLMVVGYNEISSYYQAQEDNKRAEQLTDFNEEYVPYDRNDVRGSDLLSLINKIVDFNTRKDEEKIEIEITIEKNTKSEAMYYNYSENKAIGLIALGSTYTQDNIENVLNISNEIESRYTQAISVKLAANMSSLMGDNSRKEPEELLEELKFSEKVQNSENYDLTQIQNDILKYYQYQQFKRAHFDCEELTYTYQGRVKKFKFTFNGRYE